MSEAVPPSWPQHGRPVVPGLDSHSDVHPEGSGGVCRGTVLGGPGPRRGPDEEEPKTQLPMRDDHAKALSARSIPGIDRRLHDNSLWRAETPSAARERDSFGTQRVLYAPRELGALLPPEGALVRRGGCGTAFAQNALKGRMGRWCWAAAPRGQSWCGCPAAQWPEAASRRPRGQEDWPGDLWGRTASQGPPPSCLPASQTAPFLPGLCQGHW